MVGSGLEASCDGGLGDLGDGDLQGGLSGGDGFGVGVVADLAEALGHALGESVVDLFEGPLLVLGFLGVFEVGDVDAASVAEDVGDDEDVALFEDVVGIGGGGAVGAFGDDFCFDEGGVIGGDLGLGGGGDEDVAVELEDLGTEDRLGLGEAFDEALVGVGVLEEGVDVDAFGVSQASGDVGDADDGSAESSHFGGGDGAYVAEALDGDAEVFDVEVEFVAGGDDGVDDAPACGFSSAYDAAEDDGFSGDEASSGDGGAVGVGDAVADVGHVFFVGAHVGCGDVDFWSDVSSE